MYQMSFDLSYGFLVLSGHTNENYLYVQKVKTLIHQLTHHRFS